MRLQAFVSTISLARRASVAIRAVGFCATILLAVGVSFNSAFAETSLLTPRDFSQRFLDKLQAALPSAKIVRTDELTFKITGADGEDWYAFLDNAYTSYKLSPQDLDEIIQRHAASTVEAGEPASNVIPSRIVPIIKDRRWLAEIAKSIRKDTASPIAESVFDNLNSELIILYAEDTPTSIRYVTAKNLEEAGVERSRLKDLASANLAALIPNFQIRLGPSIYMLTAGGNYVASLLLLDRIWSSGQIKVDGEIVVAIPARDLLFVTGSRDAQSVQKLRTLAAKSANESAYSITDQLFVYRGGKFERFVSQ